jgi:hypothetical protein
MKGKDGINGSSGLSEDHFSRFNGWYDLRQHHFHPDRPQEYNIVLDADRVRETGQGPVQFVYFPSEPLSP